MDGWREKHGLAEDRKKGRARIKGKSRVAIKKIY
jgi:hypothetical protein